MYELIEAIFKEFEYWRKLMKKHFNKNLIMSEEEENPHRVALGGYVKNSLTMTMKKLEIIFK